MELREIEYILTIARCGSVTRAAQALYLTQPALSKFLKNLERQVGAPLFHRMNGALVPTLVGERYLDYAGRIAGLREDWRAERADLLGETRGRLSVAIPLMRGSCVVPEILTAFYARYPGVELVLQEEAHAVEKYLASPRGVDLVIYNDTSPEPVLIHEELGREEIVLVVAKGHPLAARAVMVPGCRYPHLDLADAADEPFVLHPAEQTTGKLSGQLLQNAGVQPRVLLRTRNSDIAIRLAASGAALAFAPESYVRKIYFAHPPLCFSVGAPKTETILYAIYHKGRYLPSYARYFLDLVRENLRAAKSAAKEKAACVPAGELV